MENLNKITVEELEQLIDQRIEMHLGNLLGEWGGSKPDRRNWEKVKYAIAKHRWTPPAGTPSVVEILREERDK